MLALPVAAAALSVLFVLVTIPISAQYAVSFPLAGEGAEHRPAVRGGAGPDQRLLGPRLPGRARRGQPIAQATADGVTYLLLTVLCVGIAVPLRGLALTREGAVQPTV